MVPGVALRAGVDGQQRLYPGQAGVRIEALGEAAGSQRAGQRIGALWVEAPEPVAAISRDPVEHLIADDDEPVGPVDVLPAPLLDRGLSQRHFGLRIEAPQPILARVGQAVEHVVAQTDQLVPIVDRVERALRGVRLRQRIPAGRLDADRVEVPQLKSPAPLGRDHVQHKAAQRKQHELFARIVALVGALGVTEIGPVCPEFRLGPNPPPHRVCRQRVRAGRVEFEQAIGKARLIRLERQRAPFEQVAPDRHDPVGAVELGVRREGHRTQQFVTVVRETPEAVIVAIRSTAEHEIVARWDIVDHGCPPVTGLRLKPLGPPFARRPRHRRRHRSAAGPTHRPH